MSRITVSMSYGDRLVLLNAIEHAREMAQARLTLARDAEDSRDALEALGDAQRAQEAASGLVATNEPVETLEQWRREFERHARISWTALVIQASSKGARKAEEMLAAANAISRVIVGLGGVHPGEFVL